MAALHEISLVAGLIASALFYLQYRKYEVQGKKKELIDSFLSNLDGQS